AKLLECDGALASLLGTPAVRSKSGAKTPRTPKALRAKSKKWPQLSRTPRHFMLARDFTKTVLHRHDLRHWLVRVRSCRRRNVAFQRAAAETAEGKIPVRADTAVA